jgi:hypothetical protein
VESEVRREKNGPDECPDLCRLEILSVLNLRRLGAFLIAGVSIRNIERRAEADEAREAEEAKETKHKPPAEGRSEPWRNRHCVVRLHRPVAGIVFVTANLKSFISRLQFQAGKMRDAPRLCEGIVELPVVIWRGGEGKIGKSRVLHYSLML